MSVACHDDWASSTSDRHSQSHTATFNPLGSVYQSMCCGSQRRRLQHMFIALNQSIYERTWPGSNNDTRARSEQARGPLIRVSLHHTTATTVLTCFLSLVLLLVSTLSWTESAKPPSSTAGTVRLQSNRPLRRGRAVGARAARECVYFIKLHHLLIYHPIQFGESSVCFWLLFTLTSVCSSTRAAMRMFRDVCFSWNWDDGWSGRKKRCIAF